MFYEDVLSRLQDAGVRFLVVGAVAMNLHGVPRMTADLDLLVELSEPNLTALVEALEALGYKPRLPVPASSLLDPALRREWVERSNLKAFTFVHSLRPLQEVDLLIESPVPFEEADSHKKVLTAGRLRIPVVSLDHLITMKRAGGRAQDAMDVEAMKKLKRVLGSSE